MVKRENVLVCVPESRSVKGLLSSNNNCQFAFGAKLACSVCVSITSRVA